MSLVVVLFSALVVALTVMKVSAAPPPGHPDTDQAARVLGLPATVDTHAEGIVRERLDSNNYSYLAVELPNGETAWLAAPRIAVAPGSRIAFGDGAYLTNFYSKKLKRTFAGILFVPGIRILSD